MKLFTSFNLKKNNNVLTNYLHSPITLLPHGVIKKQKICKKKFCKIFLKPKNHHHLSHRKEKKFCWKKNLVAPKNELLVGKKHHFKDCKTLISPQKKSKKIYKNKFLSLPWWRPTRVASKIYGPHLTWVVLSLPQNYPIYLSCPWLNLDLEDYRPRS